MSHYTKLWSHIINSTIWSEDDQTRIVWITLLALADAGGYVGASLPGLAHQSRVTLDLCKKSIEKLCGPDRFSRTKDNEGRRLKEVDGGWVILNYQKHREAADEEIRRNANAERQRRWREKHRGRNGNGVTRDVTQNNPRNPQAEAEAEAEAEAPRKSIPPTPSFPPELNTPEFRAAWEKWKTFRKEIRKRLTPTTISEQMAMLAQLGPKAASETIIQSIANGWTGLFEKTAKKKPHDPDDIDAAARAAGILE